MNQQPNLDVIFYGMGILITLFWVLYLVLFAPPIKEIKPKRSGVIDKAIKEAQLNGGETQVGDITVTFTHKD